MYKNLGAKETGTNGKVEFKLFIPDDKIDPLQYSGGGSPLIKNIFVVGNFNSWKNNTPMVKNGQIYEYNLSGLNKGFYEYKYYVEFMDGKTRYINDPYSKYGGTNNQNSGFVVDHGTNRLSVKEIKKRLPYKDLIIYELMIDDFTALYRGNKAPLDAITDKIKYLKELGINAIEFMPWTSWINNEFSWGYNPFQYFSVEHRYTNDTTDSTKKLYYLKELINECHKNDIHVIMDGVFNHADVQEPDKGFAYYWLYRYSEDSPYVGNFAEAAYFKDLDYANNCTLAFILNVCQYWIEEFKIDGIRFDNTMGLYKPDDRGHGLYKILSSLREYLYDQNIENFSLILEHSWDYGAIDAVNKVGATSCWLDPFRSLHANCLGGRYLDTHIMRVLDSARDFGEDKCPTIYIENHDHEAIALKAGVDRNQYWPMLQPYMIALFTSPGAVLIHNGQEFGENYWIIENDSNAPYADRRVQARPVRWDKEKDSTGMALISLYKKLIKIRKDHSGLRSSNFYPQNWDERNTRLNADGFGIDTERKIVIYHRWENDEKYYIILNFSDRPQTVTINFPFKWNWKDLVNGWQLNNRDTLTFEAGSNWGYVFCNK